MSRLRLRWWERRLVRLYRWWAARTYDQARWMWAAIERIERRARRRG